MADAPDSGHRHQQPHSCSRQHPSHGLLYGCQHTMHCTFQTTLQLLFTTHTLTLHKTQESTSALSCPHVLLSSPPQTHRLVVRCWTSRCATSACCPAHQQATWGGQPQAARQVCVWVCVYLTPGCWCGCGTLQYARLLARAARDESHTCRCGDSGRCARGGGGCCVWWLAACLQVGGLTRGCCTSPCLVICVRTYVCVCLCLRCWSQLGAQG